MKTTEAIYVLGHIDLFTIALFGKDTGDPKTLAIREGATRDKVCLIDCSKNPDTQISTRAVFDSGQPYDMRAEGVILTEKGSAAVLRTADCPSLALYDKANHLAVFTHAGRPALTPRVNKNGKLENIVTIAYEAIVNQSNNPDIIACITGSICGKCFLHDDENGKKLAAPFIEHFGNEIITENQGLNLPLVIMNQLTQLGIDKSKISHDGLCTYTNDDLYSHRQGRESKEDRNITILVLH